MTGNINALVEAEVERRLSDPIYLREANQRLIEKVQKLEHEAEAMVPIKAFYDAVTESDDWMDMAAAVKVLAINKWGRNKVFDLLRDRGILRYNKEPYQEFVDRGYFKTVEKEFTNPYGETAIYRKTVVSQKGLDYIRKLITEAAA
jgi:phage antirepressor YoqD-like protein